MITKRTKRNDYTSRCWVDRILGFEESYYPYFPVHCVYVDTGKIFLRDLTMKIPFDTLKVALEQDDNIGFCLGCGADYYGIEPDGAAGECEECGALEVYGAEEILIMGEYTEDD